jgi:hypothetical protein
VTPTPLDAATGWGLAAWLALLVLATLLGRNLRRLAGGPTGSSAYDPVLDLTCGLLALHLVLLLLYGLGIRWTTASVSVSLGVSLALALAAVRARFPGVTRPEPPGTDRGSDRRRRGGSWLRSWGWGDAVAVIVGLAVTAAAWTLRALHPDFIYHWGIKGKKLLLAGGPDFAYLSRGWNHFIHPDYPRLIPELYALTSLPAGRFAEPVLMLWSAVFFAALLIALRETLIRGGVAPGVRQGGLAFLALGLGAFVIGGRLAGGADLPLGLALAAALPVLLARAVNPADDLTLGLAAAFTAASKIEGVLLAGTLVAVQLWRRFRDRELTLASIARTLGPPSLVILPWLALNLRHHLFQAANSATFEPERWPRVLAALGEALAVHPWHGLSWLILGTPLLLLARRTRGVAVVILVQLAFYLWVFFTQIGDPELLVRFSVPRLLFPLIPAAVVAGLVLLRSDQSL